MDCVYADVPLMLPLLQERYRAITSGAQCCQEEQLGAGAQPCFCGASCGRHTVAASWSANAGASSRLGSTGSGASHMLCWLWVGTLMGCGIPMVQQQKHVSEAVSAAPTLCCRYLPARLRLRATLRRVSS